MAQILPKSNYYPDKVECYGPGLEKTGLITKQPANFTVDTRKAGEAALDVSVMDAHYQPLDVTKKEKAKGLYECSYAPDQGLKHTVQVNYGGVAAKNSPFRVYVSAPTDPSKVEVFGPGVENGVKSNTPTHFNIDARQAGPGSFSIYKMKIVYVIIICLNRNCLGDLNVAIVNDKGQNIPIEVEDNDDGTYAVLYTPTLTSNLKVNVLYAGKPVPQSPIAVQVQPNVDVSKIKVDGLEPSKYPTFPFIYQTGCSIGQLGLCKIKVNNS